MPKRTKASLVEDAMRQAEQESTATELPKRFGDVPEPPTVTIADLIDKEITVLSYEERKGDYGYYYAIAIVVDGEEITLITGGEVIMRKVRQAQDKGYLPLVGRVTKPGRYYDIA